MSQYKTGTVTVTNGSATVTGSGTAFLANVSVGDIFIVYGDLVPYFVSSVASNTSLTLSAPYGGTSGSGKTYSITRDFTANKGYPTMSPQDLSTDVIFNEAMNLIDADFAGLGTASQKNIGLNSGDVSENFNSEFTPALIATYGTTITPGVGASYTGSYRKTNKVVDVSIVVYFEDSGSSASAGDRVQISIPSDIFPEESKPVGGTAVLYGSLTGGNLTFYECIADSAGFIWLTCTDVIGSTNYDRPIFINLAYQTDN